MAGIDAAVSNAPIPASNSASISHTLKSDRMKAKTEVSVADKSFQSALNREISKYNNSTAVKRGSASTLPSSKSSTPLQHLKQKDPQGVTARYNDALRAAKESADPEDGMNIALKKLAKDFGTQFYALMWQRVRTGNPNSSFGERVWDSELTREIVESGAGEELDPLEQSIFEELKASVKEQDVKRLSQ